MGTAREALRRAALAFAIGTLGALAGCAEHVHVESAAKPNPFANKPYFSVLPVDDTSVRIAGKSGAAYAASLDADHRRLFPGDLRLMREAFVAELARAGLKGRLRITATDRPDVGPFVIKAQLRRLEPGSFGMGWVAQPSRAEMVVTIATPDGKVLDAIAIDSETGADDLHPTSGIRWSADGAELGGMVAAYLQKRVYGH